MGDGSLLSYCVNLNIGASDCEDFSRGVVGRNGLSSSSSSRISGSWPSSSIKLI